MHSASDEADIRNRIDKHVEAIQTMDLEGVMSIYAPDIVSFDLVPPLQYGGTEAKRKAWKDAFATFQRPPKYEVRDLAIILGPDLAFGHSLNRIEGTLRNGRQSRFWLRWTTCFRRVDGNWLIAHEQVSAPVDPGSGKALLNLEP